MDKEEGVALQNATVVILQQQDSILKDFTRTNEKGDFHLSIADTNDYILMVSYPKYGDFTQFFKSDQDHDFGAIPMQTMAHLIEEVVVTGRLPVVIKGDTIEYDADSFTVEKNAKVEDLLKVLPGISVDGDGKITAQGKTVEKVLVDGEEFFGDDPTLVTRNIRSDMVDKVQVYEKKSEQAERTGVDDGERIQTINVELKEEARNGIFGKANAGVATDKYYTGQAMINRFKGSQKTGAFLVTGNNGTTGLSWEDAQSFGGNDSQGSMVMINNGDDFESSEYSGSGIPRILNTGVNFSEKWNGNKNKINLSYLYGKLNSDGESSRVTQNNLEDRTLVSKQQATFDNDRSRHKFGLKYDLQIDSLTSLTVQGGANRREEKSFSSDFTSMTDRQGEMLNDQERNQTTQNNTTNMDINAYLTRKFKKEGRSLSLTARYNASETSGNQDLWNNVNYYGDGNDIENSLIDQRKNKKNGANFTTASFTYTEPLHKKLNLSIGYEWNGQQQSSELFSYNKDESGNYSILDSLYSSDFDFSTLSSTYNVALNFKADKWRINFTNRLKTDKLQQENNFTQEDLSRSFLTYNPSADLTYELSKSSNLRVSFRGTNNLPSLNQIQPLRNNEDELNVYLGNESLKPQSNRNYSLNYHKFNALEGSYIYSGVSFSQQKDPFILNATTDAQGKTTFVWENLEDKINNNLNFYVGGGRSVIRDWNVNFDLHANINRGDQYNYINGSLNNAKFTSFSITPGLRRSMTSGFNFGLWITPGYTQQKASLQPEFDNSGFTLRSNSDIKYFLPKKMEIFAELNYVYEAPTKTFDEKFERILLNPGVSKKVLNDESLKISFIVNDILNQNVGFRRSQNGNIFTQNSYDTIRRYYMLKVSWDFNKTFMQ